MSLSQLTQVQTHICFSPRPNKSFFSKCVFGNQDRATEKKVLLTLVTDPIFHRLHWSLCLRVAQAQHLVLLPQDLLRQQDKQRCLQYNYSFHDRTSYHLDFEFRNRSHLSLWSSSCIRVGTRGSRRGALYCAATVSRGICYLGFHHGLFHLVAANSQNFGVAHGCQQEIERHRRLSCWYTVSCQSLLPLLDSRLGL